MKLSKPVVALLIIIVVHAFFILSKAYYINNQVFNDDGQYRLFIQSLDPDVRVYYVSQTKIKYFGVLPDWGKMIIYAAELISLIVILISKTDTSSKLITNRDKAKEQLKDLLLETKIAITKLSEVDKESIASVRKRPKV